MSKNELYQMYEYSVKYDASESILVYPTLAKSSELGLVHFEKNNSLRAWNLNGNLTDIGWESDMLHELKPLIEKLYVNQ